MWCRWVGVESLGWCVSQLTRTFAKLAWSRWEELHVSPGGSDPAPGRLFAFVAKATFDVRKFPGRLVSIFARILGKTDGARRRDSTMPHRYMDLGGRFQMATNFSDGTGKLAARSE